ncbi:hypothetical protein LMG26846_05675 [Achromobacter insuavis]|nr:hypothetical protein LMG26846_05675 [Achromobacter insuavis]
MSALRSALLWLVLFTQVWTPALAQTLPISVDRSAPGQRPVVGVTRGVPVVDIAPPSAGGISNNRFTRFNVGPSGVVLNNSGAASQTQLAGQVAGNPMLGNRHASAILNQVTTANPSQLRGMLEVAGHRANVIVANPAGITCDGCGFLNADRATLTTGKPVIGAGGALGFDIAGGRLAIEGAGLYGANLGQLDLLARVLAINAEVWADRLQVVAGAAQVDHGSGAVAAAAGDGPAPAVALDTAALGGMYANSIRLIGTEAGVGVNIGGNLAALTGSLSVDVNGDVRVVSGARLQAATDLSLRSARDIVNDGAMAAGGALALDAAGAVANHRAMAAGADAVITARGFDNDGAFTAGLREDGSSGPAGRLDARVERLRNAGTLAAGGDVSVTADALDLSGGKFVAGGRLALVAAGALDNRDGALYGGSIALRADRLDNTGGKLTTQGAFSGLVTGAVLNQGGLLAAAADMDLDAQSVRNADGGLISGATIMLRGDQGIDNRAGTVQAEGALRAGTAGALDNRGGKLLGGSVALTAGAVDNGGGAVLADGGLDLVSAGALVNGGGLLSGGALFGDSVEIQAARVDNGGGRILSGGALGLAVSGKLDNGGGTIAAQGLATLSGQALANARGAISADDLTLAARDALDNRAGLIQAEHALVLTAGRVDNRDTLADGVAGAGEASPGGLGLVGGQVSLHVDALDNQAGRVGAGQQLRVVADTLDNTRGSVASGGDARLDLRRLTTTEGALTAGGSLELVTGALDNAGRIHAGQDLKITADALINRVGGELIGGRANGLVIAGELGNAGLIDGGHTHLAAGSVTNTGRIYGDRVGIQAASLLNDTDAVIASRGDTDLGVGSLINREHALVYADGDLRLGGALDASGAATGQAGLLSNESATVEAGRDAAIAADSIRNLNRHFASEDVVVSQDDRKIYFRLEGRTELMDGTGMWLCDSVTTLCGKDPVSFLDNDAERRLLLPSSKYPESRYGPPFDYVSGHKGVEGVTAPIPPAYLPLPPDCLHGGLGCDDEEPEPRYQAGDAIWKVFGVEEPVPVPPEADGLCGSRYCPPVSTPEREQALAFNAARHQELAKRIYAFNADFNSRLIRNFFFYIVREKVTETCTTSTDPAGIIAGGDAAFTGAVLNDKSRIIAGGTLSVDGPAIDNQGAEGLRHVERVGSIVHTVTKRRKRKDDWDHYQDIVAPERLDIAVGTVAGNIAPPETGNAAPGASDPARPPANGAPRPRPPAQIIEIGSPGHPSVRVVTLPPVLPSNGLYQVIPAPQAPALIVTDRQFIGSRSVVSSDFLLRQINQDPGRVLKRLGDGFYEQKQVAEQIMLATGRRFVGDYTDNESQYKALLTAGAGFAGRFGLTLGTALTEDQMRHLTGDIVWMVERVITLPDGSRQKVLAPQVYLAVKPGDLRGDGTLIAGRDTRLNVAGDLTNSGTLGARTALIVDARNVRNTVGAIQGGSVDLYARNDIDNLAGLLKGGAVTLKAGRDIHLAASTQSNASGGVSSTRIDGVSRIQAGTLDVQAGRDLTAQAAAIAADGDARIQAGRDLNLTTAETRYGESFRFDSRNRAEARASADVGTQIAAGGNLTLVADNDVNARGARVSSDQRLAVGAGRDINVLAGDSSAYTYNETYFKEKGFLSSRTTHRKNEAASTDAVSSTFTGDQVALVAGRDLTVAGSNVAAGRDLILSAERDVDIAGVQNTASGYEYEKTSRSGFGALGGLSYGKRQVTDSIDTQRGRNTGSTLGSVSGDVLINAGASLAVTGSDVLAREGSITLAGRDVRIEAGADTLRQHESHEVRQTGLTVTASNPVVNAMQTGGRMVDAGSKVDNPVMAALAGGTAALAAVNAYDAVMADPSSAGGARIGIGLGSSRQTTTIDRRETTAAGSRLVAGQDVTVLARGGGDASRIVVTGSEISAGNDALLLAEGDILLRAAQNQAEQNTHSKSTGASIGVSVAVGNKSGLMLDVGVNAARGREDGRDIDWSPTRVVAGDTLVLRSGGDTRLTGATGHADRIIADVGRDLRIESMQDISTYAASNTNAGIAASICLYYCAGQGASISGSVGTGAMKSDWRSVTGQAGLWADEGGFQVDAGRNTALVGGIIAGGAEAAQAGRNHLATGTLQVSDIENQADYSAHQVGISGGYSFGGARDDAANQANNGPAARGESADKRADEAKPGSGLAMNAPTVVAAKGRAGTTTRSAIGAGDITIRDQAGQQALTNTAAEDVIAALNRDTSGTLNTLTPIFDKEKIQAGFEIASEAARQTGQFLTNRAAEAKALKDAMDAAPEGPRKEQLRTQYEDVRKWAPGGGYREALTALTLAAGGNVTGGASQFVQAAAVDYLQGLGAARIKEIAPLLGGEGSPGHVALHALLGCAGAGATGASCGAGASGASAAIVIGQLMEHALGEPTSKLDPVEREARINLVTSLLGGLTAALDPNAVAAVNDAARLELENNQFVVPPPAMGPASIGGTLGGVGRRGSNDLSSADENIARHLTRAWNWLFETDSGPDEARGPLETPAVPPGGDARVPGYAGDRRETEATPGYEADRGNRGTPSYDADGNPHPGGSFTPMPGPQGPQIILNEVQNSPDLPGTVAPSPALPDSPYSPSNVADRIKPPYRANQAHNIKSPSYNPTKTPEPADAQSAYESGAVRGKMDVWYAKGRGGYYRYFSDNAGTVHFSGTMSKSEIPNEVLKQLRR